MITETVLDGLEAVGGGTGPAERTCLRHLGYLGASLRPEPDRIAAGGVELCGSDLAPPLTCEIDWREPRVERTDTEATIQAACGLMAVHGRPAGRPLRLGVEAASVAAGMVATQGILAALFARLRGGGGGSRVRTSVLRAGLFMLPHYFAGATATDPEWTPPAQRDRPGPPFRTADGHLVELEALDPEAWRRFWCRLGLDAPEAGRAWMGFLLRYRTAVCPLPPAFHEAMSSRTLAQLHHTAVHAGVSLCRLRSHEEVVGELHAAGDGSVGGAPWRLGVGRTGPVPAPPRPGDVAAGPPLSGVRVIEVGRRLQGPLAGLVLALLGADVLRVEPPGGDLYRLMPPAAGDVSAVFLAFNRGKRAVELDIKSPEGRRTLLDMVGGADVFLHNWAPGKAAELRLDFDDLTACNPGLVYAHASGWGTALGPDPPFGTEYLVQAHSGLGDAVRPLDEPRASSPVTLTDVIGALLAGEGILAGLVQRERNGGRGCRVDSSLWSAALALQAHLLEAGSAGSAARKAGRPVWGLLDRPVRTANGYLQLAVDDDDALQRLVDCCGISGRTDRDGVEQQIAACIAARQGEVWEPLLADAGIAAAPVRTDLADLAGDPSMSRFFDDIQSCRLPAAPWTFQE